MFAIIYSSFQTSSILTALDRSRLIQTSAVPSTMVPLHEIVISVGALFLMVLAALIYLQGREEENRVEFTEFNSQYLGKESTRSNSEQEFPNFGVDILKDRGQGEEE